jgi:hypothetical protein
MLALQLRQLLLQLSATASLSTATCRFLVGLHYDHYSNRCCCNIAPAQLRNQHVIAFTATYGRSVVAYSMQWQSAHADSALYKLEYCICSVNEQM